MRRLVVQTAVRAPPVVAVDPDADSLPRPAAGLEGVEVDALVLQGFPEPLDDNVVSPLPPAVHGDPDTGLLQSLGELHAGELGPLVGVEDVRLGVTRQGLLQGRDAEIGIEGVRQPPTEHPAAEPVHDGHEVEEAPPHRDVGDVGAPDLVRPRYLHPLEQIRIDPVLRVRSAGVRLRSGA